MYEYSHFEHRLEQVVSDGYTLTMKVNQRPEGEERYNRINLITEKTAFGKFVGYLARYFTSKEHN